MIPRTREEKFLDRASVERFLRCGIKKDLTDLFLGIKHQNESKNRRGEVLYRRSVERVLRRGSIKDCAESLLGIKHHNDF